MLKTRIEDKKRNHWEMKTSLKLKRDWYRRAIGEEYLIQLYQPQSLFRFLGSCVYHSGNNNLFIIFPNKRGKLQVQENWLWVPTWAQLPVFKSSLLLNGRRNTLHDISWWRNHPQNKSSTDCLFLPIGVLTEHSPPGSASTSLNHWNLYKCLWDFNTW